ncbi:MAG: MBL fold metallo-hydrolase [Candidatus Marsarchaeota archaeon]|nr:MBL fold metallo-hydrolase [Candidatus Marsarchaeota archaeon]
MKISFFGAAGEVGRSCIMVSTDNTRILLDAGVKIGAQDEYPHLDDSMLKDIDGIVVSHAHLDHSGYLPHIYSAGYTGSTYVTKPTMELITVLISDYMRISNPSNVTQSGLKKMAAAFKLYDYRKEFRINELKLKFIPAGHILGSAMISVSDGKNTLLYTGDINTAKSKLFDGAELKGLNADTLITESTYGAPNDAFQKEQDIIREMVKSIKETIKVGGKIIIPSFAVGRAQEVLLFLDDNINSGALPKVPIYVDGMINKAMRIHRHNVIYCRKELQSRILMSEYDPFKSKNFVVVDKKGTRNKIVTEEESSIIVTTSGMLSGGPVFFYLSKLAGNSLNKMIMVGYQAEGTLGREMQDGNRHITIDKTKIDVQLKVETYHLSAHADRKGLESVMSSINGLKNVFIVHGEKSKSESLKEYANRKYKTIVPELEGEYTI